MIECDPLTVTLWRDEASIRAFAYGQGSHRPIRSTDRRPVPSARHDAEPLHRDEAEMDRSEPADHVKQDVEERL